MSAPASVPVGSSTCFDELLNVFWLRPETALWRSLDIEAMRDFEFRAPSLDLGCGDGTFSFIRAGGSLDITFDAYQSVANLDRFFEKADVHDSFDASVRPAITRPASYRIDYGLDHKENLLKKAATLGLYGELVQGDANQGLPFPDQSLGSVFSNILYWLERPDFTFREIVRVLRPGGRCCVMLPNDTLPQFSFYHDLHIRQGLQQFAFLEKLDRGRLSENVKHAKSGAAWSQMIQDAGLRVVAHRAHLSKTVVQMWDIGLRPLFPVLHKMISNLEREKVVEIKREWMATLKIFLEPISRMDQELMQGQEPAFHCFILEK